MLTCIACSNQLPGGAPSLHEPPEDDANVAGGAGGPAIPSTGQAIKALTAQMGSRFQTWNAPLGIKFFTLIRYFNDQGHGAYRHCKPCAGSSPAASRRHHPYHHSGAYADSEVASGSQRFHYSYRRAGSSAAWTPRLRSGGAISSGYTTPSVSARTDFFAGDEEVEEEAVVGSCEVDQAKEWVAQVEPGVLTTFLLLPDGGNDLKRIRFSREMFNKWQAQRWWAENYESWSFTMFRDLTSKLFLSLVLHGLKMRIPRRTAQQCHHLTMSVFHTTDHGSRAIGYSSSDSLDHQSNHLGNGHHHHHGHQHYDSVGLASTPKLSSISGAKTETSSMRTSSSPEKVDRSGIPYYSGFARWHQRAPRLTVQPREIQRDACQVMVGTGRGYTISISEGRHANYVFEQLLYQFSSCGCTASDNHLCLGALDRPRASATKCFFHHLPSSTTNNIIHTIRDCSLPAQP